MSRKRQIDPSFWKDSRLGRLPREVRLLYIALWNIADDAGILEDNPAEVKAQAFPYDQDVTTETVKEWLGLLAKGRQPRVFRYSNASSRYLLVAKFHKHQKVDHPARPLHPCPPDSVLDRLDVDARKLVVARTFSPRPSRNPRDPSRGAREGSRGFAQSREGRGELSRGELSRAPLAKTREDEGTDRSGDQGRGGPRRSGLNLIKDRTLLVEAQLRAGAAS